MKRIIFSVTALMALGAVQFSTYSAQQWPKTGKGGMGMDIRLLEKGLRVRDGSLPTIMEEAEVIEATPTTEEVTILPYEWDLYKQKAQEKAKALVEKAKATARQTGRTVQESVKKMGESAKRGWGEFWRKGMSAPSM